MFLTKMTACLTTDFALAVYWQCKDGGRRVGADSPVSLSPYGIITSYVNQQSFLGQGNRNRAKKCFEAAIRGGKGLLS